MLLFSVFYFSYGQLDWTPAFLIGRETHSAFSYEYSYSSLILVEYSCLAIAMFLAPVFHASLIQIC